jgi:hypothetical protein
MALFKAKELMFNLALDDDDPEEERVVLRLQGCQPSIKALVSCGRTQNLVATNMRCVPCQLGADGLQLRGAEGLRNLKKALRDMLKQLEPVEKEFQAFEKAETSGKKSAKAPAKKSAKNPAKKTEKPTVKKR